MYVQQKLAWVGVKWMVVGKTSFEGLLWAVLKTNTQRSKFKVCNAVDQLCMPLTPHALS